MGSDRVPCRKDGGRHSRREVAEAKANVGTFDLRSEEMLAPLAHIKIFELDAESEFGLLKPNWIPKVVGKLYNLERLDVSAADAYEWGRDRRLVRREGTLPQKATRVKADA